MKRLWIAIWVAAASASSAGALQRPALEDVLRHAREERDRSLAALRPRVEEQVQKLEKLKPAQKTEIQAARAALLSLGRESALLLVAELDPGTKPTEGQGLRAAAVREVLCELRSSAILPPLARAARQSSLEGKKNALTVLGHATDVVEASAVLREVYQQGQAELRPAALAALAHLGGPENHELVAQALGEGDPATVRAALQALTLVKDHKAAGRVLALLQRPEAALQAAELLAYYRSLPQLAEENVCRGLLSLCLREDVDLALRLALLDSVPSFKPAWSSDWRKLLDPLTRATANELRQECLVCLARLGDKNARREIRREYDDYVQKNEGWAKGYEQRAKMLLRLGEYDDAVRDYKRLLQMYADLPNLPSVERAAEIGLARAYALAGRLKDASATLEKADLPLSELRALAGDPDFAKLAADPRYGKVFTGG